MPPPPPPPHTHTPHLLFRIFLRAARLASYSNRSAPQPVAPPTPPQLGSSAKVVSNCATRSDVEDDLLIFCGNGQVIESLTNLGARRRNKMATWQSKRMRVLTKMLNQQRLGSVTSDNGPGGGEDDFSSKRSSRNVWVGTSDDAPEGSDAFSSRELDNPPLSTTSELDHL